jgi:threonine/homoserine/homoserine lactone efflux protein
MASFETMKFFILGTLMGLTAGVSPGPLITLVLTETLKHGRAAGIKIAISPLFTDLPIIIITLFVFSRLTQFNLILSIISLVGGVFITYLGYETIKTKGLVFDKQTSGSQPLWKGIIANFLSPHAYIFWATIGAPLVTEAYQISLIAAISFIFSFYLLLTGSKIVIVLIVARSKNFMGSRAYIGIMRLLGMILFIIAMYFIYDGLKYLLK